MDQFTEVTSEGWGGRLMGSIKGIVIGLALFIGAFPLTWWNEGRAVTRTKSLEEGEAAMVVADTSRVDPSNENRLVYLAGNVETSGDVIDDKFNVSAPALALRRHVEMYQWKEHESREKHKKLGGGTETVTTYRYEAKWDDDVIDSNRFHYPAEHKNPNSMSVGSERIDAKSAKFGAFTLDPGVLLKLDYWQPLDAKTQTLRHGFHAAMFGLTSGFYSGSDPDQPQIGDMRVTYEQILPGPFSFVAQQSGTTLREFATKAGSPILLVESGIQPARGMFKKAHDQNTTLTWLLRALGFAMMTFGMSFVLRPLSTVLDVIPLLGNVAEMGILVVSALLALLFSSLTIGAAWLWYRPLIGVGLLVAGAGAVFLLRQRKAAVPTRAAPPAPPPSMAVPPPPPPPA